MNYPNLGPLYQLFLYDSLHDSSGSCFLQAELFHLFSVIVQDSQSIFRAYLYVKFFVHNLPVLQAPNRTKIMSGKYVSRWKTRQN